MSEILLLLIGAVLSGFPMWLTMNKRHKHERLMMCEQNKHQIAKEDRNLHLSKYERLFILLSEFNADSAVHILNYNGREIDGELHKDIELPSAGRYTINEGTMLIRIYAKSLNDGYREWGREFKVLMGMLSKETSFPLLETQRQKMSNMIEELLKGLLNLIDELNGKDQVS